MTVPLLIAHRGASAEAPENTLAAFRHALALGVNGIELDVRLTRDGIPVVFHDEKLPRLTGVRGRLGDLRRNELAGLRVQGAEPIPRLTEVLALTRRRTVVQIELKPATAVAPVVSAIREADAVRDVILASFEAALVRDAARLAPGIPRMLISAGRGSPEKLLREMSAVGASGLSLDFKRIRDRAFVDAFRSRGASLWAWTVNRPADARRLAGWGVDAILTDDPARIASAIGWQRSR